MTIRPKGGWWLPPLVVACWCVGQAVRGGTHTLIQATGYEPLLYLFVPGAIAGVLLGLVARSLGLPAIGNLLSSSQAFLFGILSTILVVITLTGVAWASFNEDETGQILWIVLSGGATLTFFGVWSLLAMRAAAATRALSVGVTLILASFAAHALGYWGLVIFSQWLDRHQPELNIPIFFIAYLLITIIIYLPMTLIACGTAGIVGGLGRGSPPSAVPPPPVSPTSPAAPIVPAPAVPVPPQPSDTYHGEEPTPPQPSPTDSYRGEEPSTPLPAPVQGPAPASPTSGSRAPATGSSPQPSTGGTDGEEVPPPSETDRG